MTIDSFAVSHQNFADAVQPAPPQWRAGDYYTTHANQTTGAVTQSTLYANAIWIPRTKNIDRISIDVAATVGSAVCRLGVYLDNGYGHPGNLLFEASGTVDCSGSTGLKEITVAQTLPGGLVWLACVSQGASANLVILSGNHTLPQGWFSGVDAVGTLTNNAVSRTQASVTAALPTTFSAAVSFSSTSPRVAVRAAS